MDEQNILEFSVLVSWKMFLFSPFFQPPKTK